MHMVLHQHKMRIFFGRMAVSDMLFGTLLRGGGCKVILSSSDRVYDASSN